MTDEPLPQPRSAAPDGAPGAGAADLSGRELKERSRPRGLRVRGKLVVLVLVPIIALLVATGVGVRQQVQAAQQANGVQRLAVVGVEATVLVHELQLERDITSGLIAAGRVRGSNELLAQHKVVDQKVTLYTTRAREVGSVGRRGDRLLDAADDRLRGLPAVRRAVLSARPDTASFGVYTAMIADLLALIDEIGRATTDRALADPVRTVDALARAKEFASQQRGLLYGVFSSVRPEPGALRAFVSAADQERGALAAFRSGATPAELRRYESTVTGPDVVRTEQLKAAALAQGGRTPVAGDANGWLRASTARLDRMRAVETRLLDDVTVRSGEVRSRTLIQVGINVALTLLAVLLAVVITVLVTRSLVEPLRLLRVTALDIATRRLPRVVQNLRVDHATPIDLAAIRVVPIGVRTSDEVGEVARAFDDLHHQAVRLAAEQALLRRNVNGIFVNLSRRSQTLVERLLGLISDMERHEQDPDRLQELFRLDHLVTRMRRNDESLLVLAGSDSAHQLNRPTLLNDVLRAAVGEVEDYTRIDVEDYTTGPQWSAGAVHVVGYAVTDVVHLLAELLENATAFSPPTTRVRLSGRRLPNDHGILIEVDDVGVGMDAARLAAVNTQLLTVPVIDVAASPQLGLYVVGRLAARHDIRVELRARDGGGTTALVRLPQRLLAESDRPVTSRRAQSSAPAPRESSGENGTADDSGPDGVGATHPLPVRPTAAGAAGDAGAAAVEPPGAAAGATPVGPARADAQGAAVTDPSAPPAAPALPTRPSLTPPAAPPPSARPASDGWEAAARTPRVAGRTAAGLPVRAPMANAVPGAMGAARTPPAPAAPPEFQLPRLTSQALSNFRAAVEAGRSEPVDPPPAADPVPGPSATPQP